MTPHSFL